MFGSLGEMNMGVDEVVNVAEVVFEAFMSEIGVEIFGEVK